MSSWVSTREMARRCGVSATTLCNWVKRSREDEEYYPGDLRAIAGKHYERTKCRRGGRYGWEYRFNASLVSKNLVEKVKFWAQKGDVVDNQEAIARASNPSLPPLEASLRDQIVNCKVHGELTLERCRLCWLLKSDQEKESTGNWDMCKEKNVEKGEQ